MRKLFLDEKNMNCSAILEEEEEDLTIQTVEDGALNPAKYDFGVPVGKLLGFIVSHRGIELDPSKIKAIQDLPPPKSKKDRKYATMSWTEECQKAFDKIKECLSKPHVLVPPEPERPLLLYLPALDGAFGCVLGQHDETRRKEQEIYYMSKKFIPYEAWYSLLERTCCALTWIADEALPFKAQLASLSFSNHIFQLSITLMDLVGTKN
uniref:Reverse transcriptase/retrotransposon-derived protein RNase H-like domain-containing protein n=1 Tax=Nicotiana tabacum TaxID=4097 RepID=A0A1S3XHK9_TOBAC|nr:PREDICTED: uncharacterized protein LOC107765298 [Nicotiana tabacum]